VSAGLVRAAPLFAALGDGTRLAIVDRLSRAGPQSIAGLAEGVAVTRQAVTKHLRTLEHAGFATSRRSGRERVWELQPARLEEVHRYLDEISSQWDAAVGRLRALVEGED
jgi:DNA-binding transcriptional ArsR family regulator